VFFVTIVMMNALIAVMGDIQDEVLENSVCERYKLLVKLIKDWMTNKNREELKRITISSR